MKKQYVIIPIVMLAMLIALSMPTSAIVGPVAIDSLNHIVDSVPHGDYAIRWTPNPSPYTFSVPDNELYWVGIYDSVWMPNRPIYETYNGHTLPDSDYVDDDNTRHTGCGTCGVWFDDETGNTTQGADNTYHSWNIDNAHGTGVPIVYIEPGNPNTLYYWFYQGYDDSEGYSGCDGYTYCMDYTFTGVTASVATQWTLMVAVTCADDGNVVFNGNALPNGYDSSTKFYHVAINDVTGMVQEGANTVRLRTDDMYFHPYWMWLIGETPVQLEPDLVVDDIAGTPRPMTSSPVSATIRNQGAVNAGPFDVCLYVNDVLNDTVRVTAGLPAGDTTPVTLHTTAQLPENCYEFTVVADCGGEVGESDEGNNDRIEDFQVGYVIDVRSDADFTTLRNDPGMPPGSVTYNGTYYIQDLTITNCAGEGIHIEGVTENFVISNCTIENCKPQASGVFLNDLSKGTITGCTLWNNTAYGIEVGLVPLDSEDPTNINITCNTFDQNKIGLELIGYNCIVKGNDIRNSKRQAEGEGYGIYLYGNDTNIYNNTIENNDDYGIKLYNSTGNYVYWNDLTSNNGVGVQGWDNWATNTWNTATQVNYCYDSGTYTSLLGNYWDDFTGNDPDGDGIGTPAYNIAGPAMDNYPLMVPWRLCGDVNRDGLVHMGDALAVRNCWGSIIPSLCNQWAGDVNCDGLIHMGDALAIRNHWGEGFPLEDCCKDC